MDDTLYMELRIKYEDAMTRIGELEHERDELQGLINDIEEQLKLHGLGDLSVICPVIRGAAREGQNVS